MKAVRAEWVIWLIGISGRVQPELIFVFRTDRPSMLEVICGAAGWSDGEVVRVADCKGVMNGRKTGKSVDEGLKAIATEKPELRPGEKASFSLVFEAAEIEEARTSGQTHPGIAVILC